MTKTRHLKNKRAMCLTIAIHFVLTIQNF